MKVKSMLLASACSFGFGGAALALDQATIDAIAGELAAQGFTKLEVRIGPNGTKVEAYGPDGELERFYDGAGNLIKEEREIGDGFSGADSDDDEDDDDDHDDDHDDDDDDDHDHDDDHDDDDDDEEDDDEDDDDDDD